MFYQSREYKALRFKTFFHAHLTCVTNPRENKLYFVRTAVLLCIVLCKMLFTVMPLSVIVHSVINVSREHQELRLITRTDMIGIIRNTESEKYLGQNKATGNTSTQCVDIINWSRDCLSVWKHRVLRLSLWGNFFSHIGCTVLFPWARHFILCFVLLKLRKHSDMPDNC